MNDDRDHSSKALLKALGLLLVGIVGGVATVFLVIGSILLFIQVFDPPGSGEYGDPMDGVATFFYIVGGSFSIGAVLSIAAVVVIPRGQKSHPDV